ncbi:DUF4976 domain-containing protein (plasmid) [Sulfitobacter sp. W027]|uniref:sulfatase/phosphatase domain-containing protein n=1 Tax=Sulfitobacter sp. W027 TaxID=2867025 RepID=UPI0021A9353C|nr:sulfatase/phosphatase domain-containing protein [Sulfitobacter sp. W027]UWR35804.1 DUF4976 domain-containing protein [Sulfitobacter sp. W027]
MRQNRTIDIAATVLGRAGLQSCFGMQGRNLFGEPGDEDILIDDYGMIVLEEPDAKVGLVSLVTPRWRLSVFEEGDWGQLFDLENDPLELNNLWKDSAASTVREHLTHRLLQKMVSLRDRRLSPTALA